MENKYQGYKNPLTGKRFRVVGAPIVKKDARALVTGKPVYTDDLAPKDCLIVKVLRSPHAHALVEEIDCGVAARIPGIECILTWKDVPQKRFTMAGQTFPEPSPYDRLILDRRLRFVGDAVAIVAGSSEAAVDHAMRLIRVKYRVLDPVLDMHEAKDSHILVHPEENWRSLCPVGADNSRNLCASGKEEAGDLEAAFAECAHVVERVYHTKANQQAMMETFRAFTYMDVYGRLNVVASTQIAFHVRRVLAHALDLPKSKIRVIKPRIGGGFGAKQTVVAEIYPAVVTMKTGKAAKMIYSRYESQIAASPRHEMEVRVKAGCDSKGILKALDVYTLSNTGAYGEHGPTTVGLSGHKSIPLYGTPKAFRFAYDVVYTNRMSAGAYRGYGATQGIFAVESAITELAEKAGMDQVMPAYYGERTDSCALDRCVARVKEMIGWDDIYPRKDMGNGKVRAVGLAMAMQGSAIAGVDVAGATIKVNDDGFYSLIIGAADMGTGCDTTAYLTGMAVVKACQELRERIIDKAAKYLECSPDELAFDGRTVRRLRAAEDGLAAVGDASGAARSGGASSTGASGAEAGAMEEISLKDIANRAMCFNEDALQVTVSHTSPVSPPPGAAARSARQRPAHPGCIPGISPPCQ